MCSQQPPAKRSHASGGKPAAKLTQTKHVRAKSDCLAGSRRGAKTAVRERDPTITAPASPQNRSKTQTHATTRRENAGTQEKQPSCFHRRSASDGNAVAKKLQSRRPSKAVLPPKEQPSSGAKPRYKSSIYRPHVAPAYDPPVKLSAATFHKRSTSSSICVYANVKRSVSGVGIGLKKQAQSHHERSVSGQVKVPFGKASLPEGNAGQRKKIANVTECSDPEIRVVAVRATRRVGKENQPKLEVMHRKDHKKEIASTALQSKAPSPTALDMLEHSHAPALLQIHDKLSSENLEKLSYQKDVENLVRYIKTCKRTVGSHRG